MSDTKDQQITQLDSASIVKALFTGDLATLRRYIEARPMLVHVYFDGLTALHIAVGTDNLKMARYLVDAGARFEPDGQGRYPSTIAAECEVSEELCDYIVEAEEKALRS
jgi:uncharacterized protein